MLRRLALLGLVAAAFVGGMIFERERAEADCAQMGGDWFDGLCHRGVSG